MGRKLNLLTKCLSGTSKGIPEVRLTELMVSDYRLEIENVFKLLRGKHIGDFITRGHQWLGGGECQELY